METEANEELDYGTTGDRDHEDREATLQARRRALQEPGSTRDHERPFHGPLLADAGPGAGRGGPSPSAPAAKRPRQVNRESSIEETSLKTLTIDDSQPDFTEGVRPAVTRAVRPSVADGCLPFSSGVRCL